MSRKYTPLLLLFRVQFFILPHYTNIIDLKKHICLDVNEETSGSLGIQIMIDRLSIIDLQSLIWSEDVVAYKRISRHSGSRMLTAQPTCWDHWWWHTMCCHPRGPGCRQCHLSPTFSSRAHQSGDCQGQTQCPQPRVTPCCCHPWPRSHLSWSHIKHEKSYMTSNIKDLQPQELFSVSVTSI